MCCGRNTPPQSNISQSAQPPVVPQSRPNTTPSNQVRNNRQLQQARNNAAMQKRLQQQTAENIKNRHR